MKFRVVSILDATHVSARIISYIKFDTLEEIEFPNTQYMLINRSIQEYYSCTKNRLIYTYIYIYMFNDILKI